MGVLRTPRSVRTPLAGCALAGGSNPSTYLWLAYNLIKSAKISEMAEREGFEPPDVISINGFQDRRLKPLGHLS